MNTLHKNNKGCTTKGCENGMIPCSCPKGGIDDETGRVCPKCFGSQWIDCPECHPKTHTPNKRDWEDEFNRRFIFEREMTGGIGLSQASVTTKELRQDIVGLRDFIQQVEDKARKEGMKMAETAYEVGRRDALSTLIKEIAGTKRTFDKRRDCHCVDGDNECLCDLKVDAHNNALQFIQDLLTSKLEKKDI